MESYEYFVGFEREPKDLDTFLENQGYDLTTNGQDNSVRNYEHREGGLVDLFYFPNVIKVKEGEVPDWSKSGYNITSELMISAEEFDAVDEAQRLTNETVRKYDGIFYDSNLEDFFQSDDL